MKHKSIYVIGSLRNPHVPVVARVLRGHGFDVFDSWFAAGEIADDAWRDYEKAKGLTYREALADYAADHVYQFDLHHLKRCDMAVLVMPGGKSAHLELGFMVGSGKPGFILFDEEPERWDVMVKFATAVCFSIDELVQEINNAREEECKPNNSYVSASEGCEAASHSASIKSSACSKEESIPQQSSRDLRALQPGSVVSVACTCPKCLNSLNWSMGNLNL